MRVITVIQPWATLIAIGAKRFETRPRRTHIRGPLAIHAGKKVDREACEREPIKSTLVKYGYTSDNLPTGAVVATCLISECWKVIGEADVPVQGTRVLIDPTGEKMFGITQDIDEFHFGDLTPGRYAWELTNVKQLAEPIPAKGQQGFWNFPLGEEQGK
ncbi:ASCH domain-containing protein [Paenibacillus oenotherae]|uniref:ASCH domain-containing protein n=1 Tax=Paenibacillus oenotherae TaxID=1435645 RepID=A0ABS7D829_9BACL|nr:ASCH domain-containing protein [Paenibacillus oenotherae]MBW7475933.1 ASCH domain-containing protein [Paenibacillus oenotherae]